MLLIVNLHKLILKTMANIKYIYDLKVFETICRMTEYLLIYKNMMCCIILCQI